MKEKKLKLKTWLIPVIISLSISMLWLFIKTDKAWLHGNTAAPKCINFEMVAGTVAPGAIVEINSGAYGIIVDPRGFVLSSSDVLVSSGELYVASGGVTFPAALVSVDQKAHLALIKILADRSFEAVPYNLEEKVKTSEWVVYVCPDKSIPLSGKITAFPTDVACGAVNYKNLFKTNFCIDHGASRSGCPLIDAKGELIGISLVDAGTKAVYGVPVTMGKYLLTLLEKLAPREDTKADGISWLGAELQPHNEYSGVSLEVMSLPQDSPLAEKGIFPGDVITGINGAPIAGLASLSNVVPDLAQGKKIRISLLRDEVPKRISLSVRPRMLVGNNSLFASLLVLLFFIILYVVAYFEWISRFLLFLSGAVVLIVMGKFLGFYDIALAWELLRNKAGVLYLLAGLNIVTILLEEGGVFKYLAKKALLFTRDDKVKIICYFFLLTFFISLFVNNLSTMMVLAPIVLSVSRYVKFDPKPVLIGMIISSDLGGASTMIGDFPNMIISAGARLRFFEFIRYMLPICLIQLAILILYFLSSRKAFFSASGTREELLQKSCWKPDKPLTLKNETAAKRGLIILLALIISFIVSDLLGISPAPMALVAGIVAIIWGGVPREIIIRKFDYQDLLFFSSLFIMVGAAEQSGLMKGLCMLLTHLSFDSELFRCVLLLWIAAFFTAFLNAGPTTAFFLPIVLAFQMPAPHHLDWWALSLGVLAGSSAALTGATAGSVTATMYNQHIKERGGEISSLPEPFSFKEYGKFGMPLSLIFLIVSTIYIIVLYRSF